MNLFFMTAASRLTKAFSRMPTNKMEATAYPLNNVAEERAREASQDSVEQMCQAVLDGNLAYFLEYADGPMPPNTSTSVWTNYLDVMKRWIETVGVKTVIHRNDLMAVYLFLLSPSHAPGVHKFRRMLAHKNLISGTHYCAVQGTVVHGFRVKWLVSGHDGTDRLDRAWHRSAHHP